MTEAGFAINLDEDEFEDGEQCPLDRVHTMSSGQQHDVTATAKRPRDALTGREPQPKRKNK